MFTLSLANLVNAKTDGMSSSIKGPRVDISTMSDDQLRDYRDAWARITAGGLNSVFQDLAEDHGIPRYYCP